MMLSAEALGLLGLAENATPEEVETRIKERFAAKAEPAPEPEPVVNMTVTTTGALPNVTSTTWTMSAPPVVDEVQMRAEIEAKVRAEFEATDKAAKVAALMAKADAAGKLSADNRETFRAAAEKDLAGAESLLATMSAVAPVARTVSSRPVTTKLYANEGERLTEVFRLAARKGLDLETAKRQLGQ